MFGFIVKNYNLALAKRC